MNEMNRQNRMALELVTQDIQRMVLKYPFHAALLGRWKITSSEQTSTMGVHAGDHHQIHLILNPRFYLGLDSEERLGLLNHEVNHVLLGHLELSPKDYSDKYALLLALECSANEFIREPLPGNAVRIEHLGLPPFESTIQRYRRLKKCLSDQPANSGTGAAGPGNQEPCRPIDDHDVLHNSHLHPDAAAKLVQQEVEQALSRLSKEQQQDMSPVTIHRIASLMQGRRATAHAQTETLSVRTGDSALPWSHILARAGCHPPDRQASWNYPNRRLPHLVGIVPGRRYQPFRPRVMAVIDTSGSISSAVLANIVCELKSMSRRCRITVVECDDRIQKVYPFSKNIETVQGRGGTDFSPPLNPAFLRRVSPEVVVYFTDGEGPAPAPPSVPVIWCLTTTACFPPATWGMVVRMS